VRGAQSEVRSAKFELSSTNITEFTLVSFVSAGFWVRNQWLLAELYRRLGEEQNAVEIEDELRLLLEYADTDHPIPLGLNSLAVASDAGG